MKQACSFRVHEISTPVFAARIEMLGEGLRSQIKQPIGVLKAAFRISAAEASVKKDDLMLPQDAASTQPTNPSAPACLGRRHGNHREWASRFICTIHP